MCGLHDKLVGKRNKLKYTKSEIFHRHHDKRGQRLDLTSSSAVAEGPSDALVSRNSATTKCRYRVALFA